MWLQFLFITLSAGILLQIKQGSFALGLEWVYLSIEYVDFDKPLRERPCLCPRDLAEYGTNGLFGVYE